MYSTTFGVFGKKNLYPVCELFGSAQNKNEKIEKAIRVFFYVRVRLVSVSEHKVEVWISRDGFIAQISK